MVTMHVGLVGAPALAPAEYVKHARSFQLFAIAGTAIPIGTYDPTRAINLGTNRWTFRLGLGMVTPFSKTTAWESANSFMLYTDNNDVFGGADTRSQDPLFVSENHVTHAFNPKWWGSVDLRWQYGGETHDRRLRGRQPHEHPRRRAHARPHVHPALHAATSRTATSWRRAVTRTSG